MDSFGQTNDVGIGVESGHRLRILVSPDFELDFFTAEPDVCPCVGKVDGAEGWVRPQQVGLAGA